MRLIACSLVAILCGLPLDASPSGPEQDARKMHLRGTLRTGVMAIGAETTGVTLTTKTGATWELQLMPRQKAKAERLDGKSVRVSGIARERPGVELRTRRIIEVRRLEAAPGD